MAWLFDGIRAVVAGVALAMCASSGATAGVAADGTGFTFQGKLSDAGTPVAEAVDLRFRLYDAAAGGVQVGPEVMLSGVSVSEGVFAADLDFGAQFMGEARWLEVDVRLTALGGSYATLSPRQLIKPAPTSQFAMEAGLVDWANITGMPNNLGTWSRQGFNVYRPAGGVGVGVSMPLTTLHLRGNEGGVGNTTLILDTLFPNAIAAFEFFDDGTPLWSVGKDASLDLYVQSGEDRRMTMRPDGRVGLGTSDPASSLHIQDGSLWINGATGGNLPASAGSGLRIWHEAGLDLPIIAGFDYVSLTPVDILMQPDGGRVGVNTLDPLTRLHLGPTVISESAFSGLSDLLIADGDAGMTLASTAQGTVGSTLSMIEVDGAGDLVDHWAIFRRTPAASSRLDFSYGTAPAASSLAISMSMLPNGTIGVGTVAPVAQLDVRRGASNSTAINAENTGTGASIGVRGVTNTGFGVYGEASSSTGSNYGVYGLASSPSAYGVFAAGRLGAAGTKSFMIDHPTNPEEQFLLHYSTESPEPQNAYNGVAVLDAQGQAWVRLPEYFEAINTDYRYQLTSIGGPAAVYIAREIEDNAFLIGGGSPGMKVSWEVKARRADRYVERMGAPVELDKTPAQRGLYLMPELYDQPREKAINHRVASPQAATSGEASDVSERN